MSVKDKITMAIDGAKHTLIAKKPEIFIGLGILGAAGTAVLAATATIKAKKIIEDAKSDLDLIDSKAEEIQNGAELVTEDGEAYDMECVKKDKRVTYTKSGIRLALAYAPSLALFIISTSMIISSHNEMASRNTALSGSYIALDQAFKGYRKKVANKIGEEKEDAIYNGKEKVKLTDENGKTKTVEKQSNGYSIFSFAFDDACLGYRKNPMDNKEKLIALQNLLQTKLNTGGKHNWVPFNELLDAVGLPQLRDKKGQCFGWNYGDIVDFGIERPINNRFNNGLEPVCMINCNCKPIKF